MICNKSMYKSVITTLELISNPLVCNNLKLMKNKIMFAARYRSYYIDTESILKLEISNKIQNIKEITRISTCA
jgi:hypothetical protein